MQACGGVAGGDDGGEDSVFAGHEEACAARVPLSVMTAAARANRASMPERGFRDKHIAVAETAEVLRAMHDAYWSGCAARRCGVPNDDVLADFRSPRASCAARPITSPISRTGCPASRARRGCVGAATEVAALHW